VQGVRVRAGIALAAIGLVALPLWQVSRNYRANDHHRRTYEIRYFRALFAALEPRAAIVREGYATDQAVLYKLIGERAAGRRWITLVPPDRDAVIRLREAGYAVYAFSDGKRTLQDRGLKFEPITLEDVEGAPEERAIDMTPSPLYRLVRVDLCEDIGNVGWRDITHLASGGQLQVRIDDYRPFDASVLFYAAGGPTQDPTTLVIAQGPHRPTLTSTSFLTSRPADRARLDAALRQDQVIDPAALARAPVVQRSELRVNDRGEFALSMLAWRSRPLTLRARAVVDLNNPRRAIVCGWSRREFFAAAPAEPVAIDETGSQLFGQGWRPPEPMNEGGHMRRTSANEQEAEILVPLARTGRIRIRVRARALGSVEVHPVALAINGRRVSLQVITHAWTTFEWVVPADYWATGFNRLTFASAEPGGEVGIAVSELSFELVPFPT